MGNLMGLLFSVVLLFPVVILGVDMYGLTALQITLETRATMVGYRISSEGGVRQQLIDELAEDEIEFMCLSSCTNVSVGQEVKYQINGYYMPLIIGEDELPVSVIRTTMIGYL